MLKKVLLLNYKWVLKKLILTNPVSLYISAFLVINYIQKYGYFAFVGVIYSRSLCEKIIQLKFIVILGVRIYLKI